MKYTEYIRGKILELIRKISQNFFGKKQLNIENITDTMTQYEKWRVLQKTYYWKLSLNSRKRSEILKPFLQENISGDRIQITAVLALLSFFGLFGGWAYMSRNFIKNAIFGIYDFNKDKEVSTPHPLESMSGALSIRPPADMETSQQSTSFQEGLEHLQEAPGEAKVHDARVQVLYIEITPTPQPEPAREYRTAIMSNYWPPLGGINCDNDCSTIATGESWYGYVGQIVACPQEFNIGTVFLIEGNTYQCRDRGGAIITEPDGRIWLDILTPISQYIYKTELLVEVIRP